MGLVQSKWHYIYFAQDPLHSLKNLKLILVVSWRYEWNNWHAHCMVGVQKCVHRILHSSWHSILVSGCPCVRLKHARHILWTVHARVLKFHIWIPHGKMADTRFFLSELSPFLELCFFGKKSEWNLMHAISCEPCMLRFWNFIYGFLMEK